jgi:hypothetical protein
MGSLLPIEGRTGARNEARIDHIIPDGDDIGAREGFGLRKDAVVDGLACAPDGVIIAVSEGEIVMPY